ncbi:MAG: molybdopterin-dependent oxidoreductase, partial [Candidatus Zixiibacteriota bacterium]
EEITTCPLCGVGCQIRLLIKENEIIGTLPAEDTLVNNGQLCVKGRFCITELVNNHQRLKKPYKTQDNIKVEISWEEALELIFDKLSTCSPERFGMLISPNCSNEDLYIAQKFTRVVMGSSNIDTSARGFYGSGFNAYLNLLKMSIPLSKLKDALLILCVGLDTRFGRSVVGVELRKAIKKGAKIITINPREHDLALIAEKWLRPVPGREVDLLRSLVSLIEEKRTRTSQHRSKGKSENFKDELERVAKMLKETSFPVILVGSDFLQYDKSHQIFESIEKIARNIDAGIIPLPAQNNLLGSILMGCYPELLPGGLSSTHKEKLDDLRKRWGKDLPEFSSVWNSEKLLSGSKVKVLYLIGEVPSNFRPPSDFLIFQNIYPPDSLYEAGLVLPSTAFTEMDGTFINGEGRIQRVRRGVLPPGQALPDWKILGLIAQKMGEKGFDFSNPEEIHKEISSIIKGFGDFNNIERKAGPLICEGELIISQSRPKGKTKTKNGVPFILNNSLAEHSYRGFSLTTWVEGARKIFNEGLIDLNPEDANKNGISEGDEVVVTSAQFEKVWLARISNDQLQGTLHVTLRQGEVVGPNPHPVRIRKKDV